MARKKNNSTVWILAAVAVAGYFAFKRGGILNQAAPAPAPQPSLSYAPAQRMNVLPGIASELPNQADIGIIAPRLDPTGMQINFY